MTTTPEKTNQNEYSSLSNLDIPNNPSAKSLIKNIYKLFNKKYSKMPHNYNINIIDNIIYNEKSHIVAKFKDRLIIDDTGEFLKRYYKKKESDVRLPKFYEYYDLYSKIFPNYTTFFEGKYLYQNIQKKQKMIDLQEKMEMEEKNRGKNDSFNSNIFNTDAIDSILNGTNNEGMEIIFNVNKNNIKQDEDIFKKEINDIIDIINGYENKNKNKSVNKLNNKEDKNSNNVSNNNINKDNILNKNISLPINLNYSKNKRLRNSSSISTINNTNITYYNNIQSIISKFFNIPSQQKNNFLNLHNNTNKNKKINSKIKYYQTKDKNFVEKIEQNLFKKSQKSIGFQKNLSQNISTSNQTQKEIKDISISKKNSSIYTKKPSSSTSSTQRNKIKKNITNSSSYKISNDKNIINTIIKNKKNENRKKNNSPLTSRNPPIKNIGLNLCKTKIKTIKSIKGNKYFGSDITSRNRYSNNSINSQIKAKSTLRGSIYSSTSKINENNNKSKINSLLNNTSSKLISNLKHGNDIGYKEMNFLKNGIKFSKNKSNLKEKLLYNQVNIKSSRNDNKIKNKNISQPKTIRNKNNKCNVSRNDSSLKIGILDIMNIKKKDIKGINIKNFSKALNISNINAKKIFSKTHRNSFGLLNK